MRAAAAAQQHTALAIGGPSQVRAPRRRIVEVYPDTGDAMREVVLCELEVSTPEAKAGHKTGHGSIGDRLVTISGGDTEDTRRDAAHCFGVTRCLVELYAADAGIPLRQWQWQWGGGAPLVCAVRSQEPGVRYVRDERLLRFGLWRGQALCRSVSTVAHEAGHACLDALAPRLYRSSAPEPAALHEAFADLSVLWYRLAQPDLCHRAAAHGLRGTWLTAIAGELWGGEPAPPLRDLDNALTGPIAAKGSSAAHRLGLLFSGFVVDLVEAGWRLAVAAAPAGHSDAECLLAAARTVRHALVLAVRGAAPETASFAAVADRIAAAIAECGRSDELPPAVAARLATACAALAERRGLGRALADERGGAEDHFGAEDHHFSACDEGPAFSPVVKGLCTLGAGGCSKVGVPAHRLELQSDAGLCTPSTPDTCVLSASGAAAEPPRCSSLG
eukprot:TRINITY_DN50870_c0_g1_i1.p1 TRINITY_DN50870_c0_g1~~TRINITY_DN50870_c0_g1_i1.p1  ORF type:complete len:468 (+),score=125.18 TRINITY_DN50870_c0_g1_i1:71-1405(+)